MRVIQKMFGGSATPHHPATSRLFAIALLSILLGIFTLSAGCGQKGPLKLPEPEQAPQEQQ